MSVVGLLVFAPVIVFYFVMACDQYQCSVTQPVLELIHGETTLGIIWARAPSFTWTAAKIYLCWVSFQVKEKKKTQNKMFKKKICATLKLKVHLYFRSSSTCVSLMSSTSSSLDM